MADKITLTTPKGIAVFPALIRPDTKFDELGQYKCDLRVPVQEAQGFIKKIEDVYRNHIGKAHPKNPESGNKNALYAVERDDDGNATGNVILKIRVKNKLRKDGEVWDRRPRLFDAKLNPLTGIKSIWGGTEMKVSCEVYCWSNGATKGVSLQPLGVQILKLVEGTGGGADASSMGFEAEDGFTAEEADDVPFDTSEGVESDADEDF
jgi:hypothetical protein